MTKTVLKKRNRPEKPDPVDGDTEVEAASEPARLDDRACRKTALQTSSRPEDDPRRKALELLTRREHSHRELVAKLTARGIANEAAEQAVVDLAGRGWQDDARFAEVRARGRAASGHGPVRIRAELAQHGIDTVSIEAALATCEVDWAAQARELVQRRFGPGKPVDRKDYARRGAFLQRRGFDLDSIRHALSRDEE